MPAASCRIIPARNMSRCETISASFGVSRRIGRKKRDRRMGFERTRGRNDGVRESGSPTKTQGPARFFGNLSDAAASIPMLGCQQRGRRQHASGHQAVSGRCGGHGACLAHGRLGHSAGVRARRGRPIFRHLPQRGVRSRRSGAGSQPARTGPVLRPLQPLQCLSAAVAA